MQVRRGAAVLQDIGQLLPFQPLIPNSFRGCKELADASLPLCFTHFTISPSLDAVPACAAGDRRAAGMPLNDNAGPP